DDLLVLHLELRKVGEDGTERLGVASTFRMPLSAAERRTFPPGDPRGNVKDGRGAFRPAGIVQRLISLTTHDQREGLRRSDSHDHRGQEQNKTHSKTNTASHLYPSFPMWRGANYSYRR